MEYSLESRLKKLKEYYEDFPSMMSEVVKNATIRAVEKAADLTPPTDESTNGANTITGEMKAHWATDSRIEPVGGMLSAGKEYQTILANNVEYASYVNDGHRMDRHFVPGLYINDGVLEYDTDYAEGGGGIVVGNKTSYVQGLHMTDKAKEEYKRTLRFETDKLMKKVEK